MELIDTHSHLTSGDLARDIDGVLARSRAASVIQCITVGTDPQDSAKAIDLAERFDNVHATVAIHPHDAKEVTGDIIQDLKKLAQHEKVVAVGETGFDLHYDRSLYQEQRRAFAEHLRIAAELNLPVIIHCRKAFDATMDALEQFGSGVRKVVFHCFSGSPQQARIVLNHGFHISFTGVVTFKNAQKTRQAAEVVPLDRLMVETDCPYMSPEPMRKQKTNEPALMIHTAKFLAGLKKVSLHEFAERTTATARDFFDLPKPSWM